MGKENGKWRARADGKWHMTWLYELASLDPVMLEQNFREPGMIDSTVIECHSVAALVDTVLGGRVDYVLIDVEGFEHEVMTTMNLARHRPHLITYEFKVMEMKKPVDGWRANEICLENGYYMHKPQNAERVC